MSHHHAGSPACTADEHEHDHDHTHEHEGHEHGCITRSEKGCGCADTITESFIATDSAPSYTGEIPAGCEVSFLRILEMDCPTEETLIRKKLGQFEEVVALDFNLLQRRLTVVHQAGMRPEIEAAIKSLGMEPIVDNLDNQDTSTSGSESKTSPASLLSPQKRNLLMLAGISALAAEAMHWLSQPEWLSAMLALIAILACGPSTYKKGWIALKSGELNINALMTIAVTGAFLIGQWPEAAMVIFLFNIAEIIEAGSLDRVRNAVQGLIALTPSLATVRQEDGRWQEVETKTVMPGSIVRIRPGERIALDGVLTTGQSTVNQAAITGESLPVEKTVGESVFAGTLNEAGSFEYRVTAAASESTLARIIHAVQSAQGKRAPMQRFVDRFAAIYTPIIFAIALCIAVLPPLLTGAPWLTWIYKALVLLVIACPCALVISTPVSIVSALAAAARRGVLIKGGVYLEAGRKLKWLALDKTGTITQGRPVLTDSMPIQAVDKINALGLAVSLAARSDHPVSVAIARAAEHKSEPHLEVEAFVALPGRGVEGTISGVRYLLGNHRLIHELGACSEALEAQLGKLERQGKSVILLTDGKRVLWLFAVADTVRSGSAAAISELKSLGIKVVMLSGDNQHTAEAIAAEVGISEAYGDLLPEDKQRLVDELASKGMVGMVGDGINDAPALASAGIGFAMGSAGTDTAIETADVALMDDELGKISYFVRLSQATHAVLVQNIALALSIKAVFLVLTVMGMGTMWMAVFADMGASLLVVGNGLRLLKERSRSI